MGHPEGERDEGPKVVAFEKVGAAQVQVVDVDVEGGIVHEDTLRIDVRALAAEQDFPLRVLLDPAAQHQALGSRVFELPVPVLFVKGTAEPIAEIRGQLEPELLILRDGCRGGEKARQCDGGIAKCAHYRWVSLLLRCRIVAALNGKC